jgi:penicillin-binding protein 2
MMRTPPFDRLRFVRFAVLLVLAVLLVRLWQLQVVRGDEYYRASEEQRLVRIPIAGARGEVLDRNGIPLATSQPVFTVSVLRDTYEEMLAADPSQEALIQRLADLLSISVSEVVKAVARAQPDLSVTGYELVDLDSLEISPEAVSQIIENRDHYPGLIITRKPVRYYPQGDSASQIIGYIRQISPDELALLGGHGYSMSDLVGKLGIERAFEKTLRGVDGGQLIEVDRKRTYVETVATEAPARGGDVVLTIDLSLQKALEAAIDEQLIALRSRQQDPVSAPGGAGVAIDIKTGQILAAATRPGTSPSEYTRFSGSIEAWPGNELDKVTKASLVPGSVWKPVTLLAALAGGVIDRSFVHLCTASPDPDLAGKACHAHGSVDVPKAVTVSCNAYLWTVGKLMWRAERNQHIEIAQRHSIDLGLGVQTGVQQQIAAMGGYADIEAFGSVPGNTPRYGDSLNSAIGQGGVTVSPLQVAQLYATLARRGVRIPTSLVLEVREADGTVRRAAPTQEIDTGIPKEFFDLINEGLRQVPVSGTAAAAFSGFPLDEIPVAGKTGTGEIPCKDSHGWFAAYAPADDPEIAIAVVIEHGGYGGVAAAPVVRRVLEHYFGIDYSRSSVP